MRIRYLLFTCLSIMMSGRIFAAPLNLNRDEKMALIENMRRQYPNDYAKQNEIIKTLGITPDDLNYYDGTHKSRNNISGKGVSIPWDTINWQ